MDEDVVQWVRRSRTEIEQQLERLLFLEPLLEVGEGLPDQVGAVRALIALLQSVLLGESLTVLGTPPSGFVKRQLRACWIWLCAQHWSRWEAAPADGWVLDEAKVSLRRRSEQMSV